jgi:NitT/TauT family transport system substrate-binding protein
MLRARKELAFALGFATTLLWSGVWSPHADAAVGEPDTITCAYPVWVGFGPVHLANELGYFADEGITVVEILDDDMPNAVAAMERGDIDCYLRTVGEYQGLGRRKDTQGIIIGTIDVSTGGDGWAADRAIQSVCDLKGKTIAVEPNLPARLLLQEALRRQCNLSIADNTISRTSPRPMRSACSPAPMSPRSAPTSRCSVRWSPPTRTAAPTSSCRRRTMPT